MDKDIQQSHLLLEGPRQIDEIAEELVTIVPFT